MQANSPRKEGSSSGQKVESLPGIRHIIAVGSGKGGVGKSTVAINLALALNEYGGRVGLVDADVFGPSIPGMLGLPTGEPPLTTPERKIVPAERFGLQTMSMGLITGDDTPAVLRGPMVSKYLQMFIGEVAWSPLDYLVLDLPPGTGDTQLTLAQSFPLSGAIIVTTPQDVSLKIARRGLRMFQTVQVPILGVIENMSTFICPHCSETTDIFRRGGGERMSGELGVPFLGAIPLDGDIVMSGDMGRPIFVNQPFSQVARAFSSIADLLVAGLDGLDRATPAPFLWKWKSNEGAPEWAVGVNGPEGSATIPVGFKQLDPRTLSILWQDSRQDRIDVRDLRLACHCALCVEEMSGRPLLDPGKVAYDVAPRTIASVGNYALGVDWSDGHNSGIYAFSALRDLGDRSAVLEVEDV